MPTIAVSKKTLKELKKMKEIEELKTLDGAIRILLERLNHGENGA